MSANYNFFFEHLENISRKALEEYQSVIRSYVRRRQGVYALYRRGKLYYVGLASNLRQRLNIHLKDHHAASWDRFSIYVTIGDSHLRELEALILRIVKPKANVQMGKLTRSEDLRRRFKRDVKKHQAQAVQDLFSGKPFKSKEPKSDERPPALAKYIKRPLKLRAHWKGTMHSAHVRADGRVRFAGKLYDAPSGAGTACRSRPTNGWTFWEYERARGDWVRLDELRR